MLFELGFSLIVITIFGFGLLFTYGICVLCETIWYYNIKRAIYMRKWHKLTRTNSK